MSLNRPYVLVVDDEGMQRNLAGQLLRLNQLPDHHIGDSYCDAANSVKELPYVPDYVVLDVGGCGELSDLDLLAGNLRDRCAKEGAKLPHIIFYSGAIIGQHSPQSDILRNHGFEFSHATKPCPARLTPFARIARGEAPGPIPIQYPSVTFAQAARPGADPKTVAQGLKVSDFMSAYDPLVSPNAQQQASALTFAEGLGNAVSGTVVFSLEKAAQLRASGSTEKIILISTQGSTKAMQNAALYDGIINVSSENPDHFSNIMRSSGVSALVVDSATAMTKGMAITSDTLEMNGTIVRAGDTVTIDPTHAKLYPGTASFSNNAHAEQLNRIANVVRAYGSASLSINFLAQADTRHDMQAVDAAHTEIGLSRMEHHLMREEGLNVLRTFLFDPSPGSRDALQAYLRHSIRQEIVRGRNDLSRPTFRVFDCKPSEIFTPQEIQTLQEKYGLTDLRGTQLAAVPGFYEAQVNAILQALPHTNAQGQAVRPLIAVPMVENLRHFDMLRHIIIDATERTWTRHSSQVTTLPMIETPAGASKIDAILDRFPSEGGVLMIGGSDYMSALMGGVGRKDSARTYEWMTKQDDPLTHPFRAIHPLLHVELEKIANAVMRSGKKITLRFCGVQAQYPGTIHDLAQLGFTEVSVPATARSLQGLPTAFMLMQAQNPPQTNTFH